MHDDSVLHTWFIFIYICIMYYVLCIMYILHTKILFVFTQHIRRYLILTQCTSNSIEPLEKQQQPLLTWKASFLLVVMNSHPPWSLVWLQLPHPLAFTPFTPFPPLSNITLITTTTSTITVFFVQDNYIYRRWAFYLK